VQPLWLDVERNARAAAGDDPRFPPLTADDVDDLAITVSVLSRTESVPAHPDGLRAALRPGTDGLVVEADGRRGTFLPSVWRTMPEVDGFLRALLAKAGLPDDPWPADLRAWRYTTDEFGS
jgi:AmmeMemoRadiSam system protein A